MVVPYTVEGNSFHAEKSRLWSQGRLALRPRQGVYDLHPDGERFAVAVPETRGKQDHVTFVFNFFDELRRIAPTPRR